MQTRNETALKLGIKVVNSFVSPQSYILLMGESRLHM